MISKIQDSKFKKLICLWKEIAGFLTGIDIIRLLFAKKFSAVKATSMKGWTLNIQNQFQKKGTNSGKMFPIKVLDKDQSNYKSKLNKGNRFRNIPVRIFILFKRNNFSNDVKIF